QGGPNSTALAGPGFMAAWGGRNSADYYRYVSTQMPYGNAGGLDAATYANIISFIYAVNGSRPGTTALTADNQTRVNTFTDGHIVDAVIGGGTQVAQNEANEGAAPAAGRGAAAGRGGRGRGAAGPAFGQTVFGTVPNY